MVVILLERVPPSLRGELTRWFLEPKAGLFVGNVSAMVRMKLWEKIQKATGHGAAGILLWKTNTEQGFRLLSFGDTTRKVTEWEGLQLITKP